MMSTCESGVALSEMSLLAPSLSNVCRRTSGAFITRAAATTAEEPSRGCLNNLLKPWNVGSVDEIGVT